MKNEKEQHTCRLRHMERLLKLLAVALMLAAAGTLLRPLLAVQGEQA